MYYDYSNIDNVVIISSVCITIMKTLRLGGKRLLFFRNVVKDLLLFVLTTGILS